jgi:hypothetical protein
VKQFSDSVCSKLASSILNAFKMNRVAHSAVLTEVLYHQSFVQKRTAGFVGKTELIDNVSFLLHLPPNNCESRVLVWGIIIDCALYNKIYSVGF